MEIVIVSKTKMASNECVGAIVIKTGKFLRLLDEYGNNQTIDCEFKVGEFWEITFEEIGNVTPPHIEDVLVTSKIYLNKNFKLNELSEWIQQDFFSPYIWKGSPDNLFNSLIRFTSSGSGYISIDNELPNSSTGFWIADADLKRRDFSNKVRYNYPLSTTGWRNISYVGKDNPIDIIPAGTLMRVSLARWWSPNDSDDDERCYLQLSGWYLE